MLRNIKLIQLIGVKKVNISDRIRKSFQQDFHHLQQYSVCEPENWFQVEKKEKRKQRFKRTSILPMPPLQSCEVMTGKIKGGVGGNRGMGGGGTTRQLGSLLPCLAHRDKSCLFMGLSVSPAFHWAGEDHTRTQTHGTSPNCFLNRLSSAPRRGLGPAWLVVNLEAWRFSGRDRWLLFFYGLAEAVSG